MGYWYDGTGSLKVVKASPIDFVKRISPFASTAGLVRVTLSPAAPIRVDPVRMIARVSFTASSVARLRPLQILTVKTELAAIRADEIQDFLYLALAVQVAMAKAEAAKMEWKR